MDKERRLNTRYGLRLNVRFEASGIPGPVADVGKTVNVSSGGVLIICGRDISIGSPITVAIEWPCLLDGTTPLQLVAFGSVVRRHGSAVAVCVMAYHFRTMARRQCRGPSVWAIPGTNP